MERLVTSECIILSICVRIMKIKKGKGGPNKNPNTQKHYIHWGAKVVDMKDNSFFFFNSQTPSPPPKNPS